MAKLFPHPSEITQTNLRFPNKFTMYFWARVHDPNSVSVSRDFSHTKSCTIPPQVLLSPHSREYLRQRREDTTTLPHSFSPCTPQPHTSFSHPRSNINATLRITDRKITEILEIKIFHHRFQQKCYQPNHFPYLIL